MNSAELDNWLDIAGLMPPLPSEAAKKLKDKLGINLSSSHTFLPNILTRREFDSDVLPVLNYTLPKEMVDFISNRVEKTFELRNKLKMLKNRIVEIVGEGNFSALWLDREAFSADSMEHRALMTEAVVHIYSSKALQEIVTLFSKQDIPMIPYGEGGGYNMGVTPMAPAVTISVRGIDHISEIKPSRKNNGKYEISVGAGVPFKDLVQYLMKRGYVLRCDPNTPRAATGGIAATGSNGGRKAFEVILSGRAVTHEGLAVLFATSEYEANCINNEPFLLARKFFSIEDVSLFEKTLDEVKKKRRIACPTPNAQGIVVPLQGMKANANMLAQAASENKTLVDTMADLPPLPISAFVGAEGTTGFIYEVTFEIEKPLEWLQASRWHFTSVDAAMAATREIKKLNKDNQPEYFEFISGQSIRRYLIQDFPSVFTNETEAVIILAVEGETERKCQEKHSLNEETIFQTLAKLEYNKSEVIIKLEKTNILNQNKNIEEFEILRKPREELPKKLRTKCKTDMEIRTEYLGEVLKIVDKTSPKSMSEKKQDVLFGHLTPNHTAIIHWNIGGFDLYDEEQADIAWDYLESVIGKAQNLAPKSDKNGSARFTGEHGVAGKAPFLWLNYIPADDFLRMCKVKDLLDPKGLYNPDTLFLRTSHSRALRARLLNTSAKYIKESLEKSNALKKGNKDTLEFEEHLLIAENFAVAEGQKCTRCNSCKVCPVIDAEHELEREKKRNSKNSVLPSKRNILMFMEKITHIRRTAEQSNDPHLVNKIFQTTSLMMKESAELLKKCFYCRRCDKACPVDIEIHPLMRAYQTMGKLPSMGSKLWGFLYERLMGEDIFKSATYRIIAFFTLLGAPFLAFLRKIKIIPDWIKTYTVPPTLSLAHYHAHEHGIKIQPTDNFVLIKNDQSNENFIAQSTHQPDKVFIRYRGCMDTFGNPAATEGVDEYFKNILNARIVDLEKKMCCGFPFEADGLHERAKQAQIMSLIEIAKCISRLVLECHSAMQEIPKFILFSNCPTCCEAIKEMRNLLKNEATTEYVRLKANITEDFDMRLIDFDTMDTAELAMSIIKKIPEFQEAKKAKKTVGLKVPCHNTKSATAAQLELLNLYFTGVAAYDRCCGLSGTGRLKHPKIGTKISEKLFEQIREQPAEIVVSGCPSCRDGVKMQKEILAAKKDEIANFEVSGIFQEIMKTVKS
ncbi:FAD-binding and (Fe-S)-binding domain-containing protein [Pigmentibacter ruber]|uniref:FAD-binding and (Fe-S)-binding domain-containing protein n=1 Tax=Pigmentibacter ruber TaxID=2683196 RepID=UPI00131B7E06|nr:FAD-binding and (Fe-S)-binding domain-containing protein [Pigmentibacter ruber]